MPGSPQTVRHCSILTRLFPAPELAHQLAEQQHKAYHQYNGGENDAKEDKGKAVGLFQQRGKVAAVLHLFAVVQGVIKEDGTVDAPIGRHKTHRKKMCVTTENSREAVTHYFVEQTYRNNTRVRLGLETGRTHQIRVHMAYIGHPVTGDEVYGNGSPKWLCGQCLHAKKIGFIHPDGRYMEFDSELPDYFKKLLANLETQKTEI